ncbi:MAG TPA: alpha-2-macroglobulin family protein, partial [Tepidisphaeraceae bacterium]|nr:alpha-2-macroglobulin family protein [Tepidisphaeraceae bacterium]
APRIKGEIVFLRDGFGAGDVVKASMRAERAEGGIPAGASVQASAIVDGVDVFNGETHVEANGNVSVEFKLPTQIERGDGMLALVVKDGGVVETISKTIPILVKTVDVAMYPEGGDLVAGLPGRVYIEARTPNQKPADIVGEIVDSRGHVLKSVSVKTEHEGRGRFDFTPRADETYSLRILEPAGIAKVYALPAAKDEGVSLMSDALVSEAGDTVKLTVGATKAGAYTVVLSKHTTEVASRVIRVDATKAREIELTPPGWADGVLTATVKDAVGRPVAERLVFRRPARGLHVSVVADKSSYTPAGEANVTVTTTDDEGKPVSAMVGITATDESVLQMIEKRERAPGLAEMVLLEDEVKELADADVYLNANDPKGPMAVDLLLGTQGWRRFATVDEAKFLAAFGDQGRRALADLQPVVMTRGGGFGGGGGAGGMEWDEAKDVTAAPRGGVEGFSILGVQTAAAKRKVEDDKRVAVNGSMNRLINDDLKQKLAADVAPLAAHDQRMMAKQMAMEMPMTPPVRIYAHELRADHHAGEREDFTETLYWCAGVKTDAKDGTAKVSFKLNDAVTSFKVSADAFDEGGAMGEAATTVSSVQPFYVEPKVPLEVSCGDVIKLPIAAVNGTSDALANVKLTITGNQGLDISQIDPFGLGANEHGRRVSEIKVGAMPMNADLRIRASAGGYADDVTREMVVKSLGFPMEVAHGGTIDANSGVSHVIEIPDSVVPGSIATNIALYPTPLANMTEALKRLMQEPNGCFEQTSSTTYPLVMADQYFMTHSGVDPELIAKSNALLAKGYDKLKGFECKNKGYEWFGQDPGHECLSAFGLLEFTDMSQVREVDQTMLKDTRGWLLARRDGKGGYSHERRSLHTWIADPGCANGYCTWALLECGEKNLDVEVKWMKDRAQTDDNSYVTALAANVLYLAGDKEAARMLMDRLAQKQDKDGHVLGAKMTVVGSGGESLEIETTALATLAWLREPSFAGNVEKGIRFLADSCEAGRYGSTQSTVLALRAIVAYDKARAHPAAAGKIQLVLDGKAVGEAIAFNSETRGAIQLPGIAGQLSPGKHEIELKMSDGASLPYAMAVTYNRLTPASSEQCKLRMETALRDTQIVEGSPSEVEVKVTNVTDEILPSPIAIVGLPGGLEVRHDQLKELVKADRIAAYEVRGREVVLYWRDIGPKEKIEIPLSVIAAVPGMYTGPASRAYLYYTDEFKQWSPGMRVGIEAK